MTEIITDEQRRIRTLEHLDQVEARLRALAAGSMLAALEDHSRDLTRADQHDRAYAIWAEFIGDGGRTTPDHFLAGIFAQASKWLDHPTIMTLARSVWGSTPFDETHGDSRVQWMPDDSIVILTIPHLLSDGTRAVADVIVSDSNLTGALR